AKAFRRPEARLAGDEGIWFFIAGDLCLFTVIFLLFMTGRMHAPAVFGRSRRAPPPSAPLASGSQPQPGARGRVDLPRREGVRVRLPVQRRNLSDNERLLHVLLRADRAA